MGKKSQRSVQLSIHGTKQHILAHSVKQQDFWLEKHFSRSTIFSKTPPELLPVCKKEDRTVNNECLTILFRTFIWKDIDSIANIIVDSDATDHVVGLHCESDPPKSKEELREVDKSVFDSSIAELDFGTDTTNKILKTVVKVHKDCETDVAGNVKVSFPSFKIV